MSEAVHAIAKAADVDEQLYGLFLPPHDKEVGKWLKDDYPLEFYNLVDINPQPVRTGRTIGRAEAARMAKSHDEDLSTGSVRLYLISSMRCIFIYVIQRIV